ncbi:MAG: PAS domain S-box protein [Paludibacter sp.]
MDKKLKLVTAELRRKAEAFLYSRLEGQNCSGSDSDALEIIQELLSNQTSLLSQNQHLLEAEMEFHKERDYYKDIFNNQPAGLYRIRVSGAKRYENSNWVNAKEPPYFMETASPRFCEILEMTHRDFDKNPYVIVDLVCDEEKESFVRANEEANRKLIPFQWEGKLIVNGQLKWIRLESLPRELKNGDILWTGILYDVTQRKLAEEALKESEEKYRLLFVTNPQPMWIIDCETLDFIEVNDAAIRHYGYSKAEFLSMTALDVRPLEDIPGYLDDLEHIIGGQEFFAERRHVKKDGELIFVEIFTSTIYYKGKLANHVLINDITERKRIEDSLFHLNQELESRVEERTSELLELNKSLRATEEKLRTVADYNYNWEYWRDPDGQLVYMSPSVLRITGYTIADFQNNPDLVNDIIYKEDIEKWEKHRKKRCSGASDHEVLESVFRILTKTGEVRWIAHICRRIYNEDNKYLGVRVSNRDVTESVEVQNQLVRVTVDVSERERNSFSRDLHDGLGPLLSTIKLYFQMLSTTTDIEKRKIIEENGNKNIDRAIQTTRELARGLSSQFLSRSGYILAIQDFIHQLNDSNKVRISFVTNTNDRFNKLLEVSLYRITTELLRNTLSYSQATEVSIEFVYDNTGKVVSLLYSDNGIGFDLEEVQRRDKGLGLTNIFQRTHILRGNIKVVTKPEAGLKVYLQFPIEGNTVFKH